jgi:hypothetical protein
VQDASALVQDASAMEWAAPCFGPGALEHWLILIACACPEDSVCVECRFRGEEEGAKGEEEGGFHLNPK